MARRFARGVRPRFSYESVFGTPLGTSYFLPEAYEFTPPGDPDLVDDPVWGGAYNNSRDPIAPLRALPGGSFTIVVPMDLGMVGHWLRMLLGTPSATGSDPNYTHTKASGADTLPSTTWQIPYDSGDVLILNGCVLNSFGLELEKTADYQRVTLGFEARDWSHAGALLSGSAASAPASLKLTRYTAAAAWNGVTMGDALAATFNYSNALERYNTLSGDAFPAAIDTGLATIGGTLRLRSMDETFRDLSKSNALDDLVLSFAHPSDTTNRRFDITLPATRLRADGDPIRGPGAIEGSYSFRAEQTSGAAAATFALKNGHASYA